MVEPKKVARVIFATSWMLIFAPDAWAYLDPGAGSLIIQSLVAALAAIGFAVRLYWRRIRLWFRRPATRSDSAAEDHHTEAE